MSDLPSNVDEFQPWPAHSVVALLPSYQDAVAAWEDLGRSGIDVTQHPRILQGEEGARILDRTGSEHGGVPRLRRFIQNLNSKQNVLALFDEGLRNGDALLTVASTHNSSDSIADVLQRHGGHAMYFFGEGIVESLSGPYQKGQPV
jgi:hypothetical protein